MQLRVELGICRCNTYCLRYVPKPTPFILDYYGEYIIGLGIKKVGSIEPTLSYSDFRASFRKLMPDDPTCSSLGIP